MVEELEALDKKTDWLLKGERLLFKINEALQDRTDARRSFDIADVIEANDLKNPDPIVFDREVARRVMMDNSLKLNHLRMRFLKEFM